MRVENQPKLYLALLYQPDQLVGMRDAHFQLHLWVALMKIRKEGWQKSGCQRFDAAQHNGAALSGLHVSEPLLALLELFQSVSDVARELLACWGQGDALLGAGEEHNV